MVHGKRKLRAGTPLRKKEDSEFCTDAQTHIRGGEPDNHTSKNGREIIATNGCGVLPIP